MSAKVIGELYGVDGRTLQRHYKEKLSDYLEWKETKNPQHFLLYPKNIGKYLSIDETALSNGELYTIVTNKEARGKKGCLVALIKGTKAEVVISHLLKLPTSLRRKVREITLDMASAMILICERVFTKAVQVTDRFHVQKLVYQAVQELRIRYRWEALDNENEQFEKAKGTGVTYKVEIMENGDTVKQMLARSRYLLLKHPSRWTTKQSHRAAIIPTLSRSTTRLSAKH